MPLTTRQSERKAWLEEALEKIDEALLKGISSGVSMTFNGRSIQRHSNEDLARLQKRYSAELSKLERIEAGTQTRTIRVIG